MTKATVIDRRWRSRLACAAVFLVIAVPTLGDSVAVPVQPSDPTAAKAYGVFVKACAGCHQSGRLKGSQRAAASFGNILDLDAVATNPAWVEPGNADASPLYTSIQSRAMPVAVPGDPLPEITASDLGAVRDWIEQMPKAAGCREARIPSSEVAAAIAAVVKELDAAQAARTRFISLVPLHGACAAPDDIEAARTAVTWVLNSVSLGAEPVRLKRLGPQGLILQLDLGAIGWEPERWQHLADAAPAAPFLTLDASTRAALKSSTPLVAGDWFADAATRPPLYNSLLGVPETLAELMASLRIDLADTKRGAANRIGLKTSAVARGNRLLERRTFANGAAWIASEFAPTAGRPDLFDLTVAAATATTKDEHPLPTADATVVHFDLPNGFPAFFAASANGTRINDVPQSILKDDAYPSSRVAVAQSCLGCHASMPVALQSGRADDMRTRLLAEPTLSKDQREKLLTLHSDPAELQRKIDEDRARLKRALGAADIDPSRQWGGVDAVPALIARYHRPVSLAQLADLADLEPTALLALTSTATTSIAGVLKRLALAPISRADADAVLREIAISRGLRAASATPVATVTDNASLGGTPELTLSTDRPVFQSGDLITVTARTNVSCYLTILDLDARGRATVLYPNEFNSNNFVDAGQEVRIPTDNAPYQFRLRDKGQETLIGICSGSARPVDGIRHNFEFERFTELGEYRAFLNRNWESSGEPAEVKPGPGARASTRRAVDPSPAIAKPAESTAPSGHEPQARTAIRITIE